MEIKLKNLQRHMDGPGDHLVAQIQQIGDGKTQTDTTDVIIETDPEGGDIRIADGNQILKIRLDNDFTVKDVLKNDEFIG